MSARVCANLINVGGPSAFDSRDDSLIFEFSFIDFTLLTGGVKAVAILLFFCCCAVVVLHKNGTPYEIGIFINEMIYIMSITMGLIFVSFFDFSNLNLQHLATNGPAGLRLALLGSSHDEDTLYNYLKSYVHQFHPPTTISITQ